MSYGSKWGVGEKKEERKKKKGSSWVREEQTCWPVVKQWSNIGDGGRERKEGREKKRKQ